MYKIDQLEIIEIGVVGENEAKIIEIDVRPWLAKWPDASFGITAMRPGEETAYPCQSELENGILKWIVTGGDVAISGRGKMDVRAYQGTLVAKTPVIMTIIEPTMPGSETDTPPEAAQGWMDDLNATRLEVENNAKESREAIAETRANARSAKEDAQSAKKDAQFLSTRSAVWVGEEAPPEDGYDVWVNPEGDESVIPGGEGAVQSVNGKTGKVELTAEDVGALPEDTIIPAPYELPTASASVKGGVKVGNGLVMDGETIMLAKENGLTLIKSITLTAEQSGVKEIIENFADSYDGLMITVEGFNPSGTDKTLYTGIGKSWTLRASGGSFEAGSVGRFVFRKLDGIWDIFGYIGSGSGFSDMIGQVSANKVSGAFDGEAEGLESNFSKIKYLRVYTFYASGFPEGMTVKIYGKAAKE